MAISSIQRDSIIKRIRNFESTNKKVQLPVGFYSKTYSIHFPISETENKIVIFRYKRLSNNEFSLLTKSKKVHFRVKELPNFRFTKAQKTALLKGQTVTTKEGSFRISKETNHILFISSKNLKSLLVSKKDITIDSKNRQYTYKTNFVLSENQMQDLVNGKNLDLDVTVYATKSNKNLGTSKKTFVADTSIFMGLLSFNIEAYKHQTRISNTHNLKLGQYERSSNSNNK